MPAVVGPRLLRRQTGYTTLLLFDQVSRPKRQGRSIIYSLMYKLVVSRQAHRRRANVACCTTEAFDEWNSKCTYSRDEHSANRRFDATVVPSLSILSKSSRTRPSLGTKRTCFDALSGWFSSSLGNAMLHTILNEIKNIWFGHIPTLDSSLLGDSRLYAIAS